MQLEITAAYLPTDSTANISQMDNFVHPAEFSFQMMQFHALTQSIGDIYRSGIGTLMQLEIPAAYLPTDSTANNSQVDNIVHPADFSYYGKIMSNKPICNIYLDRHMDNLVHKLSML